MKRPVIRFVSVLVVVFGLVLASATAAQAALSCSIRPVTYLDNGTAVIRVTTTYPTRSNVFTYRITEAIPLPWTTTQRKKPQNFTYSRKAPTVKFIKVTAWWGTLGCGTRYLP